MCAVGVRQRKIVHGGPHRLRQFAGLRRVEPWKHKDNLLAAVSGDQIA
jgi:hypothetical protein